jgi:hypothetical protein
MRKWISGLPIRAFLLVSLVGGCTNNTPEGKSRSSDKGKIAYCWAEQKKASLSPDVARMVAATCEKMESDFQQKNGFKP